ncbi:HlyD family efflux transporter periplasmic adaptor subunit [Oxalobacteraceae bacterium OTU3REALA1]|nr:HlyD family efflux transporter periplasmic adaptor subunit [Oxalobacteraceae bacterium OTU3REALA1]
MDIKRSDAGQRQRRRWQYAAVGVLTLGVFGYALASLGVTAPSSPRNGLWLDTVKRGDMLREVSGPGALVPREVRWVTSESAARVERVLVKPGVTVDSQTVIVEMSQPELIDAAMAAQADLSAFEADAAMRKTAIESQLLDQRANIAGAINQAKSAQMQEDAEKELLYSKIIPALQVKRSILANELAKMKVDIEKQRLANLERSIQSQVGADRARLEQKRHALAFKARQVEALKVRAGYAGVLQQVSVEAGQQVAAGANLARVARVDDLMAQLRIPEIQAADVRVGQGVRIDTRNGVVAGKVARVDPTVRTGAVTVDIDLPAALPDGARPDLSITGTIEIERLHNVLYVGRPTGGKPDTVSSLFRVAGGAGDAERVSVRFGRAATSVIEVRGGLAEGDRVILSDISQWSGSDRLRLK